LTKSFKYRFCFVVFGRFKFINPEICPNTELDDAWLAFKILLQKNITVDSQEKVKQWFKNFFNLTDTCQIYLTDSGRTALYLILKSLNLPKNSQVLIQGFSCVVVPNAVLQAGYQPVVCDIEPQTFNFDLDKIEDKITPQTKAWIVQHTFGIMVDMHRVKQICNQHKIVLIEDCAHSLGSTFAGKPAGSWGETSMFSFGRDKIVSSIFGGAVIINKPNSEWQRRLNQEYQKLPPLEPEKELKSLVFTIISGFILPLYHFWVGKIVLSLIMKLKIVPDIYSYEEMLGTDKFFGQKYSDKLAFLLLNQLKKFEKFRIHRKKIAKIYSDELNLKYYPQASYLRFPVNLEWLKDQEDYTSLYNSILSRCKKEGIFLGIWYQNLFANKETDLSKFNCRLEDLPTAKRLLQKRVINLPTHIHVNNEDAVRIVKEINTALQAQST